MAVDTKIAVLLLCIGVALTLISYFGTQIPPTSEDITTIQKSQSTTEESTRYDSFYALLTDKQKKQFVAIYAEKNENVQISIQVQNFDKDQDANDIKTTIFNKDKEVLLDESEFKETKVNRTHEFRAFNAPYSGFYLIYLDSQKSTNSDQWRHVFVSAKISGTNLKTSEVSVPYVKPPNLALNIFSIVGPILIGTSIGIFVEVLYRKVTQG